MQNEESATSVGPDFVGRCFVAFSGQPGRPAGGSPQEVRPYGELFFLMPKEPRKTAGEFVSTPFELHDVMQVAEKDSLLGYLHDHEFVSRRDPPWSCVQSRLLSLFHLYIPTSHAGEDRALDGSREWGHRDTRGATSETGGARSTGKKH